MKALRVEEEWQRAGVYYIRTEAMVFGFDLTLENEFSGDAVDDKYILVLDDNGKPLSTNRLHELPEMKAAKIERVATVSTARECGAGRLGIETAEAWAKELGYSHIIITSREEAVGFYEKLGYKVRENMNPETLKARTPNDVVRKDIDPRFICVYMEKYL